MLSKEFKYFLNEATDRDDISVYGLVENYLINKLHFKEDSDRLYEVRDEILIRVEAAIQVVLEKY